MAFVTSRPIPTDKTLPALASNTPRERAGAARAERSVRVLVRRVLNPLPPLWTVCLSLVLVAVTTGLLYSLQSFLIRYDGQPRIRPYAIGFLAPIMLVTALTGRRAGLMTLLFSCVCASFFLSQPYLTWHVGSARSQVEIVFLLGVGLIAVSGVGAMRVRAATPADITDTPAGAEIARQVREILAALPGVQRLQTCTLCCRGFDLSVDADISVADDLPQSAVRALTDCAEEAIRRADPLVFRVRVRAH